ncbi:MAG: hypothetical protein ACRYGL_00730 [Janthinobacterium lividum]
MSTAIRRKKSRPAWLALIAVAAAGVTIVVTLGTVVVNSVIQARRASEQSAPMALIARSEGRTSVRVTVPAASQESPDALAAQAEAGSKAAAQAEAGAMTGPAQAAGTDSNVAAATPVMSPAVDKTPVSAVGDTVLRMQKTTSTGTTDALTHIAAGGEASPHPAAPKHRYLPSRAAAHAGARHAGGNAGADAVRGEGSLRADIARYNAERGNGAERRRALTLRAASVPSVRSLWDEVPQPLSQLYRN